MVFLTSDLHFDHKNVISYCDRPFSSVEEMNATMIENWNKTVRPDDIIYVLGDFALSNAAGIEKSCKALNGYKILILGNHDRSATAMKRYGFNEVHKWLNIQYEDIEIGLIHNPAHAAALQPCSVVLHGHVHEQWRRKGNLINVGVDQWGFVPRTIAELLLAEEG